MLRVQLRLGELLCLSALAAPSFAQEPPKSAEPPTTVKKADPNSKPTLSKQLRSGLKDLHDQAAESVFSESVQKGTLTQDQYTIFLEQRLAVFEAVAAKFSKDEKLPKELVGLFGQDEAAVVSALRKDLGLKEGQRIDPKRLLKETKAILELIEKMDPHEATAVLYTVLGETAFGAQTLAKSLEKAEMKNTAGFRAFALPQFLKFVEKLNRIDDPETQTKMLKAGEKFYDVVIKANNSDQYSPKK